MLEVAEDAFDFDDDAWLNPDDTYVVTAGIVADLEEKSVDFRDFVSRNNYIFADGRMVKNTPECVERRDGELKLTQLANTYVNRYCIRFRRGLCDLLSKQTGSDHCY